MNRDQLIAAAMVCQAKGHGGVMFIQQGVNVGYAIAARLQDALEAAGVLGPVPFGAGEVYRPLLHPGAGEDKMAALIDQAVTAGTITADAAESGRLCAGIRAIGDGCRWPTCWGTERCVHWASGALPSTASTRRVRRTNNTQSTVDGMGE